jgi:hypothetical protein
MQYKISFSKMMKKQLHEPQKHFETAKKAYLYALGRYGSGTEGIGWTIKEVKKRIKV